MTPSEPMAQPCSLSPAKRMELIALPCGRGFCHSQPRPRDWPCSSGQIITAATAARQRCLTDLPKIPDTLLWLRNDVQIYRLPDYSFGLIGKRELRSTVNYSLSLGIGLG